MENNQSVSRAPSTIPSTSPPHTAHTSLVTIIALLIGIIVILIVAVGILFIKVNQKTPSSVGSDTKDTGTVQQQTNATVSQIQSSISPTTAKTAGKQLNTMEEALAFALTGSGIQYVEAARMRSIELIYTPDSKQWRFEFKSRINPHKKDKYAETIYDFHEYTVKVKSNGEFSVSSYVAKDSPDFGSWEKLPKPTEAALSSILDLAQQKVSAAGSQPGTVITAKYYAYGLDSYKGEWTINVVLAGEEEKDEKKAKRVVFRDSEYRELKDSVVKITSYNSWWF